MPISEERRKRVRDLYFNDGMTTREIAKTERMSIRDISAILKEEESKQQRYDQDEISAKAYKLFSEKKTTVDVAIELNLREQEVTRMFIEYCKLKRLHKFYLAYNELGDNDIGYFVKLCKLAKKEGISREEVIHLLQLVDEDNTLGLSYLEKQRKWRMDEIHELDMQIERSKKHLHSVNDETASTKALVNSYHISCERKRQEAENLNNELSRAETLVNQFKNNNEEYLKIQQTVENKVRSVLTDGKVLLQFALASVIEAIRINPDKYNNLLFSDTSSSTAMPAQQSSLLHVKDYMEKVLEKANRLYDTVQNHLTNSIMDNAAGVSSSDSKLSSIFNLGPYNRNDICRIEDPEIFHNSNGDIDN